MRHARHIRLNWSIFRRLASEILTMRRWRFNWNSIVFEWVGEVEWLEWSRSSEALNSIQLFQALAQKCL